MFFLVSFFVPVGIATCFLWKGLKHELAIEFARAVYGLYMPLAALEQRDYQRILSPCKNDQIGWPRQVEEEVLKENRAKAAEAPSHELPVTESPSAAEESEQPVLPDEVGTHNEQQTFQEEMPAKINVVDLQQLADYNELVKQFYIIDSNTEADSSLLNAAKMSELDLTIDKNTKGPQILIYHTHSQEKFADSQEDDLYSGIVGVGEVLSNTLREKYGYQVLHHTAQFDKEDRDRAYSKALPEIKQLLEENPDIQVVIDLHRDECREDTRLVTEVNGKQTARFMFFNGLSRTKKTGPISYLENPYQEENLAFSFQMKVKSEEYYPGLARKNYLKGYRYNMHLCKRALLIELGAQNNTYEEAVNACEPLAHLLDMVLTGNG